MLIRKRIPPISHSYQQLFVSTMFRQSDVKLIPDVAEQVFHWLWKCNFLANGKLALNEAFDDAMIHPMPTCQHLCRNIVICFECP